MSKFNLSEAAKEILDASVSSKRGGQDKPAKLPAGPVGEVDSIGLAVTMASKDPAPNPTKGVPTATPPGATPPVGSEPMKKLSGQPQQSDGRTDLLDIKKADVISYDDEHRDGKKINPHTQTFMKNANANFYEDLNMGDDVDALLEGENLSEEFKNKATTIFEAAVMSRVEAIAEQIETKLTEEFEVAVDLVKEELTEKLDGYLNYMVLEWMEQNELAIEKGLRSEITEEFIGKLKSLFEESYIDIPEEKVDAVEELVGRVEELEDALNEEIQKNVEYATQINEHLKLEAIHAACEGLTQTQVEKIKALAENVDFTTEEDFAEKLETIKESYFPSQVRYSETSGLNEEVQYDDEDKPAVKSSDPMMNYYAQAITKSVAK